MSDDATSSEDKLQQTTLPGYKSMEEFTKQGFKTLMEAIRNSNALPTGRDFDFYNAFEAFPKIMNNKGNQVLGMMNTILKHNDVESNIRHRILEDKTELVVEANDVILEKVANNIDEMNGIKKVTLPPVEVQTVTARLPVNGSWNRIGNATFSVNASTGLPLASNAKSISLIAGKNVVRPQKLFKDKIENSAKFPWQPRITEKPNSKKPLALYLEEFEDRQEYSHPYEFELETFTPPAHFLSKEKPVPPKPLEQTPLVEVSTEEALNEMLDELRQVTAFAVDVEHHSYRTFMGITCLLQISTPDKDYIIDTLCLRDKLSILNEVFTKPSIVKIFHGADRDVEWLQRDLSIYIVGMFDTHQAAIALEYPALSLAYLLKKFCGVNPNKQYQLADWRMRPLPDELKLYAREDTHYLIYIYQIMKSELLRKPQQNILSIVFERSTEVCKKRYFKPIRTEDSHLEMYRRCKKLFDNRQLYALKELYVWRDDTAREEDESIGYVLPNHMLLQIAELLPREMQGILACCSPVPPLVRSNLLELHHLILKAREQPLEKPVMQDDTRDRGIINQVSKINMDSPLHCPHDLSKTEFRENLPCLLTSLSLQDNYKNQKILLNTQLATAKPSSSFPLLEKGYKAEIPKEKKLKFLTPFERYKLTKPFIQAQEQEKAAAAEAEKEEELKKAEEKAARKAEGKDSAEPSDEQRIANVRDHFLKMSRMFRDEVDARKLEEHQQKSLLEMGGTKKRKRKDSSSDDDDDVVMVDDRTRDNSVIVIDDIQDPAPSTFFVDRKGKQQHKGQKRKSEEMGSHAGGKKSKFDKSQGSWDNTQNKQKQRSVRPRPPQTAAGHSEGDEGDNQQQQWQKRQQNRQQQQQPWKKQQQQQQPWNKQQQQPWNQQQRNRQQGGNQQQNRGSPGQKQQQQHQGKNQQNAKKGKNKQKKQNQSFQSQNQQQFDINEQEFGGGSQEEVKQEPSRKQQKTQVWRREQGNKQEPSNFVPYDYASMDFRQFQGGAGSATSSTNIQHGPKNKNRNRGRGKNKSAAMSATFNSNPNRGRGRGRGGR